MSYFRIFPKTSYTYNQSGDTKIATDILKRFTFKDELKNNGDLVVRYRMKDGETVYDLANRLYGSPDYYWILYLMNDITSPYDDLPKSQPELTLYIDSKYPGNALFMNVNAEPTNIRAFEGDFIEGETVYAATNTVNGNEEVLIPLEYRAVVREWDGNYRKLVVQGETKIQQLSKNVRIVGETSGARASFQRRILNKLAVNRFEDLFGNSISHLPSSLLGMTSNNPLNSYIQQSEMADVLAITNLQHEEKLNDRKSLIKILRVEYAQQVIKDSSRIFEK